MILTVTLNPAVDHALFVDGLKVGDTNRVLRDEIDAGGKGINLSRIAVELGAMSLATGFIGGGTGAFIRKVMARQGVLQDFVEVHGETRTNFSVEDTRGGPPTTFNERGPEIRPEEWEALLAKVRHYSSRAHWVALGGSLSQGLPTDAYRTLGDIAKAGGAKVVLDADGPPQIEGLEAAPDLIKPNAREAERLLGDGRRIETLDEAVRAAIDLRDGDRLVVVSIGALGAAMAGPDGVFRGYSPQVESKSTIGSGDSMIGGILAALERGKPLAEALAWGLAAGAATAMTDGSEIGRHHVFERLLPQARVEKVA